MADVQKRIQEILSWVAAGHEIVVTDRQKPVIRMSPIVAGAPQRVAGLHAGEIQIAADFDAPLLTIRENTR
jgi:antitoxin (DNA-binding transcriptional repressor) of toxin-antitoxin stability system